MTAHEIDNWAYYVYYDRSVDDRFSVINLKYTGVKNFMKCKEGLYIGYTSDADLYQLALVTFTKRVCDSKRNEVMITLNILCRCNVLEVFRALWVGLALRYLNPIKIIVILIMWILQLMIYRYIYRTLFLYRKPKEIDRG